MTRPDQTLLLSARDAVIDVVLAAAAALGIAVDVLASPDDALARWRDADLVLIGEDFVEAMAARGPTRRPGTFLVGFTPDALVPWSVPLGAQVIVFPDGLAALSAVLSADRGASAPVVAVVGGSGGVGASTLAAGLAVAARRQGLAAALVDLDPAGGGIDLLLGGERAPGWRWPRLLGAHGEVNDVRRFLPQVDGLTVVSMGRPQVGEEPDELPSADSVRAVVGSLARHHDLVLLDPGRTPPASALPVLRSCRRTLLVAGTAVRAVAAASCTARALDLPDIRLVVRASPGSRVPADVVARTLGLELAGRLPDDRRLPLLADHGEPPGRSGRGRWVSAVRRLLQEVLADAD